MLKNRYPLKQWDSTRGLSTTTLKPMGLWAYGIESNENAFTYGDRKKKPGLPCCHLRKIGWLSHGGLTGGDLPKLFHQGPNQQTQGFHMISPDVGRPRCVKPRFLDFGSPKKGMFFVQGRTIKGKLK